MKGIPLLSEGRGREFESRRVRHGTNIPFGFLVGYSARLNIMLNTEQIVEKSRRLHKRPLRLGLPAG